MKKLILIILWLILTNFSEKSEWYVVYYEDENTIHKCSRDKYLEIMEMFEGRYDEKYEPLYYNMLLTESINQTENHKLCN